MPCASELWSQISWTKFIYNFTYIFETKMFPSVNLTVVFIFRSEIYRVFSYSGILLLFRAGDENVAPPPKTWVYGITINVAHKLSLTKHFQLKNDESIIWSEPQTTLRRVKRWQPRFDEALVPHVRDKRFSAWQIDRFSDPLMKEQWYLVGKFFCNVHNRNIR